MLPAIMAGAAAIGAAAQVYGTIKSAQDREAAARRQEALVKSQSAEMRYRLAINQRIMQEQSERREGMMISAQATRGGGGMALGDILLERKNLADNLAQAKREVEYKIKQAELGAQIQTDLYSSQTAASYITGAGSLLTSGVEAADLYRRYG